MKKILSGDLLIVTPDEGYLLALRGAFEGNPADSITLSKNSPLLERIVEIPSVKKEVYVPNYTQSQKDLALDELKQYIISQSKILLESYLSTHPLEYNGEKYSVSKDSQQNLLTMIKAGEMAEELGTDFKLSWAPIGSIQTSWSLIELKHLFVMIQIYIHKFVIQQQLKE